MSEVTIGNREMSVTMGNKESGVTLGSREMSGWRVDVIMGCDHGETEWVWL